MTPAPAATSYWTVTRSPRYSLTFALPLLALYEALAILVNQVEGTGIRNGADVLLKELAITLVGSRGPAVFGGVLVATMLFLAVRDARRHPGGLQPRLFMTMLVESAALAVAFGVVVGLLTARVLDMFAPLAIGPFDQVSWPTALMVSLGAGLYEELLFRVLLVSVLLVGARAVFGWGRGAAGGFAVIVGALAFSAFHYVGPYGDPLELPSFLFRAIAGVAFSAMYVTRGFGVTAWTHALYDVFVLLSRGT